jgi:hypothetical protein
MQEHRHRHSLLPSPSPGLLHPSIQTHTYIYIHTQLNTSHHIHHTHHIPHHTSPQMQVTRCFYLLCLSVPILVIITSESIYSNSSLLSFSFDLLWVEKWACRNVSMRCRCCILGPDQIKATDGKALTSIVRQCSVHQLSYLDCWIGNKQAVECYPSSQILSSYHVPCLVRIAVLLQFSAFAFILIA